VEPPDILLIDALRMAPKDPYFIQTLDVLQIIADGSLPDQPIAGFFQVEPDGRVQLGPSYGAVKVADLTISEAKDAVVNHLSNIIQTDVSLSLGQMSGQQQITGEHLVGPDGMVNLGAFGQVYVSGMTISEARDAVEAHLSKTLDTPKISLDVFGYNSKVFYIIAEGAGMGDSITRLPITGNETVLDAISQAGGLSRLSSKKIWIARPSPGGVGCDQILPVDWIAITRGASTQSNYQLLPGDRVFVAGDRMVAFDSFVSKVTAPFERMLGFTLLGSQTVQVTQRFPQGLFF
jgi:polysaccharide export outer membrane protein